MEFTRAWIQKSPHKTHTMKKSIILCCFLLAGTVAFAQDALTPKNSTLSIGPSFGYGHSYITPYHCEFDPTWSAGLFVVYSPYEHFGFGGDVRYSSEGSRTKIEGGTRTTIANYIRVPVKAMFFFRGVEDDFRPKVTLGPSFGFLVSESDPYDSKVWPFDAGVNASLGFNYRLKRAIWLNVDANFYQGLMDVRKNSGVQERNGNIGLNLGIAFGL
jgi:hypothetical protein